MMPLCRVEHLDGAGGLVFRAFATQPGGNGREVQVPAHLFAPHDATRRRQGEGLPLHPSAAWIVLLAQLHDARTTDPPARRAAP